MVKLVFPLLCMLMIGAGCQSPQPAAPVAQKNAEPSWRPPAAGNVVATYKVRIAEDQLNEQYFRVSVLATAKSVQGHYDLMLEYGFNAHMVDLDLPVWTGGAVLKPLLEKGDGQYHCIIGFDPGDGRFRELYEVTAVKGDVRLKQIRGYYLSK